MIIDHHRMRIIVNALLMFYQNAVACYFCLSVAECCMSELKQSQEKVLAVSSACFLRGIPLHCTFPQRVSLLSPAANAIPTVHVW